MVYINRIHGVACLAAQTTTTSQTAPLESLADRGREVLDVALGGLDLPLLVGLAGGAPLHEGVEGLLLLLPVLDDLHLQRAQKRHDLLDGAGDVMGPQGHRGGLDNLGGRDTDAATRQPTKPPGSEAAAHQGARIEITPNGLCKNTH